MKPYNIVLVLLCLPVCSRATEPFWTAYFEAEHFTRQTGGNRASTHYFPYIGDGYLEMGGQGDTVSWNNITVPKAGKYTLIFKYANNTDQKRPCDQGAKRSSCQICSETPCDGTIPLPDDSRNNRKLESTEKRERKTHYY